MENESSSPRKIKCPQCGLLTLYTPENPSRPFCSERCRTLDLGAWASESYRIPVANSSSDSLSSDGNFHADDDFEPHR
ncbi:MAG: DNA gyrase inhibitor YacG [Bdellovibrio sp.]